MMLTMMSTAQVAAGAGELGLTRADMTAAQRQLCASTQRGPGLQQCGAWCVES
jgi:hypothetical protein